MSAADIFRINIHEIYNRPGQMRRVSRTQALPEVWGEGLASVRAGTQLAFDAKIESVHEGILVTCQAQTIVSAECSRCLTEFSETLEVDFLELFAYNPTETDEYGVHGDHVDLEPPLRDAVVLALPFNPVCQEDCFGLDPETGSRLDQAAAAPDPVVDPRWAALADFTVEKDNGA